MFIRAITDKKKRTYVTINHQVTHSLLPAPKAAGTDDTAWTLAPSRVTTIIWEMGRWRRRTRQKITAKLHQNKREWFKISGKRQKSRIYEMPAEDSTTKSTKKQNWNASCNDDDDAKARVRLSHR